jgi:hypothetical protein
MSHFAQVGDLSAITLTTTVSSVTGVETVTLSGYEARVLTVIVAEQDFIDTGAVGDPAYWIQCSYNNRIRNIYPGPHSFYNSILDIFYSKPPFPSWTLEKIPIINLDENNNIVETYRYIWAAPTPYPEDGLSYTWDEEALIWIRTS